MDLTIEEGEFVAILGENGAGKSTLLKLLCGLLRPLRGEVFLRRRNTRDMPLSRIAGEIGVVLQNPDRQLFAPTVFDEAAFALRNRKMPESAIRPRVEASLAAVGLQGQEGAFPPALSRSGRARVVIASVLAMDPGILLLDEPTAGQDYRGARQILEIARRLHREGRTLILVTHDLRMAGAYAQRLLVMGKKRILADGRPEEVLGRIEDVTGIPPPQTMQLAQGLRKEIPLPLPLEGEYL